MVLWDSNQALCINITITTVSRINDIFLIEKANFFLVSCTKYEKEIKIINNRKSMKIDIDTLDTVIIELL